MVVILVLGTFATFILIDAILSRRKLALPAAVLAEEPKAEAAGSVVEGFLVPEQLRYHPGHSWLLRERKNVMRVGVDEFAAALLGPVEKLELPKPGHWIRQGQRAFGFLRGDQKAEMISPIEGEVVEINADVVQDPTLLRQDPYGKGWLMTVFVPDEESTARNLLPANLVQGWMRKAAERLYGMQPQLAGAVAADGGRPADDLSAAFPDKSWTELTGEFFLTR
jgi:glycine cleavage system H lipoate-binding protein